MMFAIIGIRTAEFGTNFAFAALQRFRLLSEVFLPCRSRVRQANS